MDGGEAGGGGAGGAEEEWAARPRASWVLNLRVSDLSGGGGGVDRVCLATVWLDAPGQADEFAEGAAFKVVGARLRRGAGGEAELVARSASWARMKTAEPVSAAAAARVRRLTPLAGLAARGAGEEVDTVGLLLLATAPVPDGPGAPLPL